jgi:hypothetical protein
MASPTAMAKCLRADAELLISGSTSVAKLAVEFHRHGVVSSTEGKCRKIGLSQDEFRAVLMLAAAAALEADDE